MDYGYSTTSYGAQGGATGGGFLPGSQSESASGGKKSYGKDTLRPVTIKQLIDAEHPNPDAEVFIIDGSEAAQVTFVGQIRNISKQTTNITWRLDDGTGTFEVKMWIDSDAATDETLDPLRKGLVENAYARVWGKLKMFGKRHVVANIIRPVTDFNEINYHLLEATYVHLYFTKGPLGDGAAQNGGNAGTAAAATATDGGSSRLPATTSGKARKVYECIANTPQTNEGLHVQDIASRTGLDFADVLKAGDELQGAGVIYTTVDDHTWALLDI